MITEQVRQIELPAGFTVRPAEMADVETAVAMFNAVTLAQSGREEFSVEDIRSEWEIEDFRLDSATRVVIASDGALVGYSEVWDTRAVPVSPWVWARVHPQFEGLGIGTFLLDWAEQRCHDVFSRVPEDARVVMRCGALSTHQPSHDLLSGYGMMPTRSFWTMRIDLGDEPETAVLPAGLRFATLADRNDLGEVMRASTEAFQDHWGFVPAPEEDELRHWQEWTGNDHLFNPTLWFMVLDGDEVAGVSLCRLSSYEDPEMGWVNTLGVRRPWRRQGLALALLQHSFGELYRRGKRSVGLGVDADSLTGATRLYEKAGMHVIRQFINYEKELRSGVDLMKRSLDD